MQQQKPEPDVAQPVRPVLAHTEQISLYLGGGKETRIADGHPLVKRGRKFEQVLRGARDIFMSDGFEGASVDDIARANGVSKATLYSYFPDKRLLFMEVAKAECIRQAETAVEAMDLSLPARVVMTEAAWQMVNFFTSDFGQRVFRLCVAESDRFPELGREFYDSGPALVRKKLIHIIEIGVTRGELTVDDLPLAADQFSELCKADLFPRMVFSMAKSFDTAQKQRIVEGAVTTFLARYATKTS